MLSSTLRLKFWYLKIMRVIVCYQTKTIGHILKNKQNSKRACIHMTSHNENEYENEKKIT